jgi:osmoprotectant transport system ATP-binding protein
MPGREIDIRLCRRLDVQKDMFELRGVRKRFGAVEALRGIDLELGTARTTVLLGSSGSGKSTVLRLLLALVRPDAGEVRFDGRPLSSAALPALRRQTGYVVQDGGLFPHLTARANVTVIADHLRWPAPRIRERVDELRELARLPADALDRYPSELSGGQKQRVSLMRALMLDPAALLLDEPLAALDPLIRAELQDDLRAAFARLGKTVVLVTHDLGEAALFAGSDGTVVLMRDGAVVQKGALGELLHQPADPFVTRFVTAQRRPLEPAP